MHRRTKWIAIGGLTLAIAGGATGVAFAAGGDEDTPLTGSTLERASAAALEHTKGRRVVDSESGDDGAAYGVEVRLGDGKQVEVSLNESLEVIGHEADENQPNEK
jgi:uncharacterized membrane protein YkoI